MSGHADRPRGDRGAAGRKRLLSKATIRDDVERELEAHVRMRADELVAQGWSEEEGLAEARRLLGDRQELAEACVEITKSHQRAVRRTKAMDAIVQDIRYGLRTILRSPGFACVAILTLALGIGANTAMFSVVDGVLLESLPYPEPEELVDVRERRQDGGTMSVAWLNFVDWREQNSVFDEVFAYTAFATTVIGGDEPVTTNVAMVSQGIWSVFGVTPLQGRLTVEADHVVGGAPVVVVSERYWRNQLGARSIDQVRLDLNGVRASVVGVAPGSFDYPMGTDLWQPLESTGPQSSSRTAHNWRVIGRLSDGVTMDRAEEEIDAITARVVLTEPDADPDFLAVGASLQSLRELVVGSARWTLLVLLGAAGLVLLIACTNLASTLLARGANRTRELAVRASLGAGQSRLVRLLITESLILATAGSAVGVGMGWLLVDLLRRTGPATVPRLQDVGVDGSVLVFAVVVTGLTTLLFGLFPALRLSRGRPQDALRQGSRGNALGGRGLSWTLLVGGEVALALVLIVGSGLLVRSFRSMLSVELGFDASDVVSTPVSLSRVKYESPFDHAAFYQRVARELEADPAIESAGVISLIPVGGSLPNGRLELDDNMDKTTIAGYVVTSAGALEALDVPLLRGRHFDDRDNEDSPHVAIVSESFARENWPDEDPIGRTVTGGGMDNFWEERPFAQVVGVVGDVRYVELGEPPRPVVYFPYTQRPFRTQFGATVVAEAVGSDAAAAAAPLRALLERADPDIPLELSTQTELIADSVSSREFTVMLMAGFSLLALTLAVVGIYGVVSYSVATRTREMGIRLALGADRTGVVQLVVRSAMGMVVSGLLVGGLAAFFASRLLEGMLYQVEPGDPLTLAGGVLILAVAGLGASWIPAVLGTRVDPMVTMRAD